MRTIFPIIIDTIHTHYIIDSIITIERPNSFSSNIFIRKIRGKCDRRQFKIGWTIESYRQSIFRKK